ncbi:MAG: hypothetical protein QW161_06420 [Candidatus Bathyarchaeia archaeon]
MAEPRWKRCRKSIPEQYKNNSVFCREEGGYVSEKWCELCPKFDA